MTSNDATPNDATPNGTTRRGVSDSGTSNDATSNDASSNETTPNNATRRPPRVFAADDPRIAPLKDDAAQRASNSSPSDTNADAPRARDRLPSGGIKIPWPTATGVSKGIRVGAWFASAVVALATLAASVSFLNFVSVALARDDWVGWLAVGLLGVVALTGLIMIGREIVGMFQLARLGKLRREFDGLATTTPTTTAERAAVVRLKALYPDRPDMRWPLARLSEHERDIHDAGALMKLADRELMAPLDAEARRMVLRSAKRVATVSAVSPLTIITVGYVLSENIGLLRRVAELYGGRPGVLGSLRLAKLVVAHLIGTGGVAMTDDLLGQFLGQDILRRLSARLGEGAFNGALTARLGAAAIEVVRPLPFIECPPVRARDIVTELFKSEPEVADASTATTPSPKA